MMNQKLIALATFLGCEVEEISVSRWDDCTFETPEGEYLVCTDEEADQKAYDYIDDSVWAFTPNFIIGQSSVLDFDDASEKIVKAIAEQCESGNDAMKKLIDNMDDFVEEAISCDGRGHFLSSYDGEENEQDDFYIYRTN